jgi:cytoskeleton protein RodZ
VGLALLLGALVLIFLPSIQQEIARYRQGGPDSANPVQHVESASVTTTVTTPVSAGNEASGAASNLSLGSMVPADVAIPATPTNAPSSAGAVDTNSDAAITFTAKGASRIKVTDAKGVVVTDRAFRAGESASVSGAPPLSVMVSRANLMQVQVRGQAFDLAGVTKNNVARFEVK